MGHANTRTTEHIYTHLFDTDDHSAAMAALDALDAPDAPSQITLCPFGVRAGCKERRRDLGVVFDDPLSVVNECVHQFAWCAVAVPAA